MSWRDVGGRIMNNLWGRRWQDTVVEVERWYRGQLFVLGGRRKGLCSDVRDGHGGVGREGACTREGG